MSDIFVFGSNLLGIHGKGAALCAVKEHGAIMGQASGLQGNSYAIPTKKTPYIPLHIWAINKYVAEFIYFASINPQFNFTVTAIGCGLAGFTPRQIAPLFFLAQALDNIKLPEQFLPFYDDHLNFTHYM